MKKIMTFLSAFILLYFTELNCNIMWPIAFMAGGHYSILSFLLMFITTAFIKTILLHKIIKKITINKSLLISFVGNIIAMLLGGLMLYLMLVAKSHPSLASFRQFLPRLGLITYLGSNLIEILVIKLFFGYTFEQLWLPILVGNTVGTFLSAFLLLVLVETVYRF